MPRLLSDESEASERRHQHDDPPDPLDDKHGLCRARSGGSKPAAAVFHLNVTTSRPYIQPPSRSRHVFLRPGPAAYDKLCPVKLLGFEIYLIPEQCWDMVWKFKSTGARIKLTFSFFKPWGCGWNQRALVLENYNIIVKEFFQPSFDIRGQTGKITSASVTDSNRRCKQILKTCHIHVPAALPKPRKVDVDLIFKQDRASSPQNSTTTTIPPFTHDTPGNHRFFSAGALAIKIGQYTKFSAIRLLSNLILIVGKFQLVANRCIL